MLAWLKGVWEGLVALVSMFQMFARYFPPKTPTEKEQDAVKRSEDEKAEFQRTGRPPK